MTTPESVRIEPEDSALETTVEELAPLYRQMLAIRRMEEAAAKAYSQGGKIGGLVADEGKWFNIGNRKEYLAVHRTIANENWHPAYVREADWPARAAADAKIDPSARLSGFYSIGSGCEVGAEAAIEDTILWQGAKIASRSHLRNCIVRTHHQAEGSHSDTDI